MLEALGYVKVSDLLAVNPNIFEVVNEAEEAAKILNARGITLQKEAESKLITAQDYQDTANRKLEAIKRFRQAVGERK